MSGGSCPSGSPVSCRGQPPASTRSWASTASPPQVRPPPSAHPGPPGQVAASLPGRACVPVAALSLLGTVCVRTFLLIFRFITPRVAGLTGSGTLNETTSPLRAGRMALAAADCRPVHPPGDIGPLKTPSSW